MVMAEDAQPAQPAPTETVRILIADRIAQEGIDFLRTHLPEATVDVRTGLSPAELCSIVGDYAALVVRSETQVTREVLSAGKNLRIVARAGVGVDNIDLETATRLGIMVVNSPLGNVVAAAEHTIAMLLALARHIPAADRSMKAGKWEKSRFLGSEVRNKVLGIIGLGKVGSEVAKRARGLEMEVIAFDPYVSSEQASKLGVQMTTLDDLLRRSDFVTIHTSLTTGPSGTRGLIGARELSLMKPSARLINCARGGIIDEEALLQALKEQRLAGAALDVFSQEPIREHPVLRELVGHEQVVATPHLGASTEEAQVGVALDVAEQIVTVLRGGFPRAAVNAPLILPETLKVLQPYMTLLEKMGRLYTQLQPGPLHRIELSYSGEITAYDLRPLQAALIKGLLEPISDAHVNMINAPLLAKQRGLEITEQKSPTSTEFANLVTLRVLDVNGRASFAGQGEGEAERVELLSGTVMHGEPRIVRVGRYWTEFVPEGYILFCRNPDQPGMIGRVGTILGKAGVNIRHMDVGPIQRAPRPRRPGAQPDIALMIISVDDPIPDWALEEIRASGDIFGLTVVNL